MNYLAEYTVLLNTLNASSNLGVKTERFNHCHFKSSSVLMIKELKIQIVVPWQSALPVSPSAVPDSWEEQFPTFHHLSETEIAS